MGISVHGFLYVMHLSRCLGISVVALCSLRAIQDHLSIIFGQFFVFGIVVVDNHGIFGSTSHTFWPLDWYHSSDAFLLTTTQLCEATALSRPSLFMASSTWCFSLVLGYFRGG